MPKRGSVFYSGTPLMCKNRENMCFDVRLMCGLMCGQTPSTTPKTAFFASGCLLGMLPRPPSQEKSKNEKVLGSLCAHQTHINAHQFWRDPCPILEIEATTHPAHPQSGIEAISARMSPSWAKYMLKDLSAALCRAEGVWIEHWSAY